MPQMFILMPTTHPNFHSSTVRLGHFCNSLFMISITLPALLYPRLLHQPQLFCLALHSYATLGNCSIKFDCLQVMVAPNINASDCFSRIPVKVINGKTFFLDQTTRILMDHAFPTLSQPALLPTYRTDHGEIVVYAPNKGVIIVNSLERQWNQTMIIVARGFIQKKY